MSSPALRGSAEWSARRELALLLGLTRGNHYAAQELWLRKESIKAEASQVLPADKQEGPPRPAERDSRSGCPGDTRAPNARTRRSAGLLARRRTPKGVRRRKTACSCRLATSPARCGPPFELQPGSSPGAFERASAPGAAHRGPGLVT